MRQYAPKQLIIDLAEWVEVQTELETLRRPADGEELTAAEHQEAVGTLLVRALQNPNLFRAELGEIDLGKYKAIFVKATTVQDYLRVKFVRT